MPPPQQHCHQRHRLIVFSCTKTLQLTLQVDFLPDAMSPVPIGGVEVWRQKTATKKNTIPTSFFSFFWMKHCHRNSPGIKQRQWHKAKCPAGRKMPLHKDKCSQQCRGTKHSRQHCSTMKNASVRRKMQLPKPHHGEKRG